MNNKPHHIAIIMDGNGRWAQKKQKTRTEGHLEGTKSLQKVIKSCLSHEIKILSVYAFSTENWNRPKKEVIFLMKLLSKMIKKELNNLKKKDIKLKVIGNINELDIKLQHEIKQAEIETENGKTLQFNLLINYGGRQEIVHSFQKILKKDPTITPSEINETLISNHLYTQSIPDPDLVIRTSGEKRISNFLLWQISYSELIFVDILWPDFDESCFEKALIEYNNRQIRFGS